MFFLLFLIGFVVSQCPIFLKDHPVSCELIGTVGIGSIPLLYRERVSWDAPLTANITSDTQCQCNGFKKGIEGSMGLQDASQGVNRLVCFLSKTYGDSQVALFSADLALWPSQRSQWQSAVTNYFNGASSIHCVE